MTRRKTAWRLALTAALLGCVAASAVPTWAQGDTAAPVSSAGPIGDPVELRVGLGYIPSVQFAQFYLADQAGYYTDAGIDVTFQHSTDQDLVTLLGQGGVDVGVADGTSVVPAVSRGIPVVYVATIFSELPNVVFAPVSEGITTPADLAGHSIGIPGRYGSSWVALQALLVAAGLTPDDVEIVTYPDFGHGIAVAEGQVDAAVGYVNNEPVQLAREGIDVDLVRVDDIAPLPGPGLVVGRETLETKGPALRAFITATLRAMEAISADPQLGVDATIARVPELATDPDRQLAILQATIDAWANDYTDEHGLGSIDPAVWESAVATMLALPGDIVAGPVAVDDLITDELLP
jgi:NitT/TauT family transport system substrate-binding protein